MEISNLFNEMKSQQELLQKFLDLIYLQQKAIINNDIVVLEDLLTKEGAFFNQIEAKKILMSDIIIQLAVKYSIKLESNNLSDFINSLKLKNEFKLTGLIKLHESIKKLVYLIIEANNQNKILINQAKSFIKQLVTIFAQSNKNNILDRRA